MPATPIWPRVHRSCWVATLLLGSMFALNSPTANAQTGAGACAQNQICAWPEPNFGGSMMVIDANGPERCETTKIGSVSNRSQSGNDIKLYTDPGCPFSEDGRWAHSGETPDARAQSYRTFDGTENAPDEPT